MADKTKDDLSKELDVYPDNYTKDQLVTMAESREGGSSADNDREVFAGRKRDPETGGYIYEKK